MTAGQVLLILVSVVIAGVTYLCAPLLPPNKKGAEHAVTATATSDFDIEQYRQTELQKLPAEVLKKYQLLNDSLQLAENKLTALNKIAALLDSNKLNILAALARKQAAVYSEVDTVWKTTADELYANAFNTDNQSLAQYVISEAIACYEKALEINPDDTATKISLAVAHLEGQTEPMKGVMLLREITDKDPDNITANLILGKYGIVSGQFDKAIVRLEKVLSIDSLNADAYLYLAEAYEGMGDKTKAIESLEKCKNVVKDSSFSEQLSQYIEKLKNS